MRMDEVKIGMRLRHIGEYVHPAERWITVTELTERGFKYSLDSGYCAHPRLGMTISASGHEHFGIEGNSLYELQSKPERFDLEASG